MYMGHPHEIRWGKPGVNCGCMVVTMIGRDSSSGISHHPQENNDDLDITLHRLCPNRSSMKAAKVSVIEHATNHRSVVHVEKLLNPSNFVIIIGRLFCIQLHTQDHATRFVLRAR
eukprot:scaffold1508_cov178-Amphora_coffeaeformis.AAC.13